jgi:hypothetical protein
MKCIGTFLLIFFFSALVMAQKASLVQPSITVSTPTSVSLGVEFHPSETGRYTFSLKMNLTTRVDPRIPSEQVRSFTPRQYQVDGEIVAAFAPTQPGEPLHGTLQFQGLRVKNWVSSAKVADFEARLHYLEAHPTTLTAAADGNFEPSKMPAYPLQDPYVLDVEDLNSIAQALLISRISSQPLAPGQQRESEDFPIPGMVKSGIKLSVLTEYIADVPIAGRPSAEVRLSMTVPNQSRPVSSPSSPTRTFERLYGTGVWTYLLDLGSHQISFLHKTIRTETGYSVESTDSNDPVRIPTNMFTIDKEYEATARRVAASASPEREADLAAFEKSPKGPPRAASEESGAAATVSPGGEASLGDIARRLRAERAAQGPPQSETTLVGSAAAAQGELAGFKQGTFLNGDVTEVVPAQATEVQRTSDNVTLRASVGNPSASVTISIFERALTQAGSPDAILDETVETLRARAGTRILHAEKKSINGAPGVLAEVQLDLQGQPFQALDATVVSGSKALGTTCGAPPADFAKILSICQTVVGSIKAR